MGKPFIKWAGGKRQLVPELLKHVPDNYGTYFEPFLGGGALFFALHPKRAALVDSNRHLISAYRSVREDAVRVYDILKQHERANSEAHYAIARSLLNRPLSLGGESSADRAARFIYINRVCFNGLWRVNKKGEFNVPYGRYSNPKIADRDNLYACSKAEQEQLMQHALRLKQRGATVLLSNADVPEVRQLYAKGFNMRRVEARRAINSNASKRGPVGELLIW